MDFPSKKTLEITDSQRKTLDCIKEFISLHGYSPTIKEISEKLSIANGTAQVRVNELEDLGLITTQNGKSRTICIVGMRYVSSEWIDGVNKQLQTLECQLSVALQAFEDLYAKFFRWIKDEGNE